MVRAAPPSASPRVVGPTVVVFVVLLVVSRLVRLLSCFVLLFLVVVIIVSVIFTLRVTFILLEGVARDWRDDPPR